MKKITVSNIFLLPVVLFALFAIFKVSTYLIADFRLKNDNIEPEIKLSQLIKISESRVKYDQTYYLDNHFLGFNAYIDGSHYITVIKLGKIDSPVKIEQTIKVPEQNTSMNILVPGTVEDKNGRCIDLNYYPFNTRKIYYYVKGNSTNVNKSNFVEIEGEFSFFNISLDSDNKQLLSYVGFKARKSFSFIEYNKNLYIINSCSIANAPYESLHNLENLN